ncbi:MAG: PKD domain-containing protein [Gammaproteobacteria bacterium]|nr:PKD domain-containing protein [Gammaproteobacteria bacterium]
MGDKTGTRYAMAVWPGDVADFVPLPIADAGLDQVVSAGQFAQVDGSGSTDPEGDYPLTYSWQIVQQPAGSIATLSDITAVNPSMITDVVGDYVVELVVTDAKGNTSEPDRVTIKAIPTGLIPRLGGLAYYDTHLNITWLADANVNGRMTWLEAKAWAASLNVNGVTGWRLPNSLLVDPNCTSNPSHDRVGHEHDDDPYHMHAHRYNCTGSEMDHLYYDELGGIALVTFNWTSDPDRVKFKNLQSSYGTAYWSGTEYLLDPYRAFYFIFYAGSQAIGGKIGAKYAMAVWPGDVADFVPVSLPVADTGSDQTVTVNTTVQLDGNASSDPDGDYPLTYSWTITQKPGNSTAVLSDTGIVLPTFIADVPGNYTIDLVVTDSKGNISLPDTVVISTTNTVPVAVIQAAPLSVIQHGTSVSLDSSSSYDPDGDAIDKISWVLKSPVGSTATLVDPAATLTTFTPDVHGNYTVELIVTDKHGANSTMVSATITFDNIPPVITKIDYLEQGLVLIEGDTINLTSTAKDDNLDTFNYQWMIVTKPVGSAAALNDAALQNPSFDVDVAGDYTVSLVVQDEHGLASAAVTIPITVITAADAAVGTINDLKDIIVNIDPGILKNANQQNALTNKIDAVLDLIAQDELQLALDKLQNDILGKTDGCANSGYIKWDNNDWVKDCVVQKQLYTASTQQPPEAGAGVIDDVIYYLKKALGLI